MIIEYKSYIESYCVIITRNTFPFDSRQKRAIYVCKHLFCNPSCYGRDICRFGSYDTPLIKQSKILKRCIKSARQFVYFGSKPYA